MTDRNRPRVDSWDFGALVAVGCVIAGIAAVYWPAALVAGGSGFLFFYYHRERHLATQSNSRR